MKRATLKVQSRTTGNRSQNRQLRRGGFVPANVYGPGLKNSFCSFDERDLKKIFKGSYNANTILELESDDQTLKSKKVILKTVEADPLTWRPVHVDLYEVAEDRPIDIQVPIVLNGTPKGVKLSGGILQVNRRSVLLRGLMKDLPEKIEVDISELDIDDNIHISDLQIPETVKSLDSGKFTIASVTEAKEVSLEPAAAPVAEGEEGAAEGAGGEAKATAPAGEEAKKEEKK